MSAPNTMPDKSLLHKSELRKSILAQRKALGPERLQANANAVTKHVVALDQWIDAHIILLYMPIRQELDTAALLAEAWRMGKAVYMPRCDATVKGHMVMALVRGPEDFMAGAYGILEPRLECPILDLGAKHAGQAGHADHAGQAGHAMLIFVPAVAFDVTGNRLGYGGGYYDRFLGHEAMAKTCRIGLAHGVQVVEALPREPWDCRMDAVVTEGGVLWF